MEANRWIEVIAEEAGDAEPLADMLSEWVRSHFAMPLAHVANGAVSREPIGEVGAVREAQPAREYGRGEQRDPESARERGGGEQHDPESAQRFREAGSRGGGAR